MATCIWVGGLADYTTDWAKDENWSGSAKPTAADDVVFNATGDGYNCTLTAASVCKTLTFNTSYTKTFSMGGYGLTVSGSADFNTGGSLTLNATMTFDATASITSRSKTLGAISCTAGTTTLQDNLACTSITTSGTNAFTSNSKTVTTSGAINFDGSGDLTLSSSTITITGDADFHIGSTVGTLALSGTCHLDLQGTGSLDVDETLSATICFGNITCAYNGKTTTFTAGSATNHIYYNGVLTTASGGTLNLNMGGATSVTRLYWVGSGTITPFVQNGATWSCNHANKGITMIPQAASTISLALVLTTAGTFAITNSVNGDAVSVTLIGSLTTQAFYCIASQSAGGDFTFDSANYAMSFFATSGTYVGFNIDQTNGTNTSDYSFSFGSSTVNTDSPFITTKDGGATCTVNMSTSVWTCTGDFDLRGVSTFGATTFSLTIDGASTSNIIYSNGFTLYTVIHSPGGATRVLYLGDNLSCNTLTATAGAFHSNAKNLTTAGSILFDGSGILTLSGAITITGDGDFHIGAVGTFTCTTANLDLRGTGNLDVDKATSTSIYFGSITCAYNGKTTTFTGASSLYFTGTMTCASGGTFATGSGAIVWCGTGSVEPYTLAGATVSGSGYLYYQPNGAATVTISAMTTTNSWGILLYDKTGVTVTYNVTGTVSVKSLQLVSGTTSSGVLVFNTNNNPITLTTLAFTVTQTAGTNTSNFTLNMGSSVIDLDAGLATSKDAGASCTINLQTSVWTVSGSYDLTGCSTFSAGTSSVTFNGTGTVTSNTFSFYTFILNNGAGAAFTTTIGDNLSVNTLTVSDGQLTAAAKTITSVGSVLFNSPDHSLTLTNSTIIITGDGDFHIENSSGTMLFNGLSLDLRGTGNLDIDKATSTSLALANITCAYNTKTTTITGIHIYFTGTLTLASGGTLASTVAANTAYFNWVGSGTVTPFVQNGATITCTNYNTVINYLPQGASTISVGTINFGSKARIWFGDFAGVTVTYNLTGTITVTALYGGSSSGIGFISVSGSTGTFVFNTNGYDISASTASIAVTQTAGTNTSNFTLNMGDSVWDVVNFIASKDAGASCTINFGTSVWTIEGEMDLSGVSSVPAHTSTMTFDGALGGQLTTNGKLLGTLIITKASNSLNMLLNDALSCNALTHSSGAKGNFSASASDYAITVATGASFDSTGTLRLGAVTVTGDGSFHIGAVGVCTLTNCTIEMRGTGNFDIDKAGLTFVSVKFNADGKTISSTGSADFTTGRWYVESGTSVVMAAGRTITVSSYTAGDIDGSVGKLVTLTSSAPGTPWNIVNPASMTVSYLSVADSAASNDIDATNGTNVDGDGNNEHWLFPVVVAAGGTIFNQIEEGEIFNQVFN